jgi:hypothetical protein
LEFLCIARLSFLLGCKLKALRSIFLSFQYLLLLSFLLFFLKWVVFDSDVFLLILLGLADDLIDSFEQLFVAFFLEDILFLAQRQDSVLLQREFFHDLFP